MAFFLPPPALLRRCCRELVLAFFVLVSGSYLIHTFFVFNRDLDVTGNRSVPDKKLPARDHAIYSTPWRNSTFGQLHVDNGAEFNPPSRTQPSTGAPVKYRVRTGSKFDFDAKPVNYSADMIPNVPHTNFECPAILQSENDFDSASVYPTLEFDQPQIWWPELEERYKADEEASLVSRLPPLRIIVVPHSHNDPGWGWTLDSYYQMWTKRILTLALEKLTEHREMTFLWSEVVFLNMWWKTASGQDKRRFKELVREGRLELTTGGWVMTDEAVVHLYSMLHQLIEGQEWLQHNVGVLPQSAWSVDPFGFGPVMPYLLKGSHIDSMVIMRIHHAWKHWLATENKGDFRWGQRWNLDPSHAILCHQSPFTLYTMAASLGPDNEASYKFSFIQSDVAQVTRWNVREYAAGFLEQAKRSGSLTQHNTVMVILGDDFRFRNASEWDNAYTSLMQIFEEINSNPDRYSKATAEFGTVKTFFEAVRERQADSEFPLFNGDFFVYSDGVTDEGDPRRGSYWSGFYGSRPFYKQLYREAEANLRSAEILFAFIKMKSLSPDSAASYAKCFSKPVERRLFKRLQIARRHLALFAHHDAAPGVSTDEVMRDYGHRLNEAIIHSVNVQSMSVTCLTTASSTDGRFLLTSALSFPVFGRPLRPILLDLGSALQKATNEAKNSVPPSQPEYVAVEKHILVWNSLAWAKLQYIAVLVSSVRVHVYGADGRLIPSQLSPAVIKPRKKSRLPGISNSTFELGFYYTLEAASVTKFKIVAHGEQSVHTRRDTTFAERAKVRYRNLNESSVRGADMFESRAMAEDEELEILNARYKLSFDRYTGFLASATIFPSEQVVQLNMSFGGYTPMEDHDGPYLFMPKDEMLAGSEQNAFAMGTAKRTISIVEGPLMACIIIQTPALNQVVKLFRPPKASPYAPELASLVAISNVVHVEDRDGEYFMRFDTDIKNTEAGDEDKGPVLFTDQSGFSFEKRVTLPRIALEGNTYPITTMAYIQDARNSTRPAEESRLRMTLLVGRAHGASSFQPGRLELLIERRTPYDDNRGIGQGIQDNWPTLSNYLLKFESLDRHKNEDDYQATLPTLETHHASQRLNYPAQVFYFDDYSNSDGGDGSEMDAFSRITFFNQPIPSDTHLLGLRTQPGRDSLQTPSESKMLMILQKFGYSCPDGTGLGAGDLNPNNFFHDLALPGNMTAANYGTLNTNSRLTIKKMDLAGLRPAKESDASSDFFAAMPFQISSFLLIIQ